MGVQQAATVQLALASTVCSPTRHLTTTRIQDGVQSAGGSAIRPRWSWPMILWRQSSGSWTAGWACYRGGHTENVAFLVCFRTNNVYALHLAIAGRTFCRARHKSNANEDTAAGRTTKPIGFSHQLIPEAPRGRARKIKEKT